VVRPEGFEPPTY